MSNGPLPACPDDAVDLKWLFPLEQGPSPPRDEGCKHNGFGDPALHASNCSQPTPSPPFSLKDCTAHADLHHARWQDAIDADFARLDASVEKFASNWAKMATNLECPNCVGTTLARDRVTGRIAPTVTSSPDPSGVTSTAVSSLPACVMKLSPPSSVTTSFPTLVTMGGIAPADACPPPAILTKWRFYASHEGLDGSFMVNICSGKRLWQPPVLDWDLEWDIEPIPNPGGMWYCVPGFRQWIQLDCITSWIHRPTDYSWYLVEDTATVTICPPMAFPPDQLHPRQIHLALDES